MIRKISLFIGFLLVIMVSSSQASVTGISNATIPVRIVAQEFDPLLLAHPDETRVKYYRENKAEILSLTAQTMDGETAQRLEALEALFIQYPDAILNVAIDLLEDTELEVAQKAAELLAASIVMSDHHGGHDQRLNPYQQYIMVQHTLARRALRGVLDSTHKEVREVAASILASLSDEEALNKINEGVETELYSEIEAVNYTGLAAPDVGGQYLEGYLENSEEVETQTAAVTYLGGTAQYQDYIRDSVLLNSEIDSAVRGAAANTLSLHDSDYQSYALIVALDPASPPELYTEVLKGYVTSSLADDSLNPAKARALLQCIDGYSPLSGDSDDMTELRVQLEQYLD